jgi:hypothetical protein
MKWYSELRVLQAVILDQALDRVGACSTLQRGLSYDSGCAGNLLGGCFGNPGLAENRVPFGP